MSETDPTTPEDGQEGGAAEPESPRHLEHKSWQLQVLEANRAGDPAKLKRGFKYGFQTEINLQTVNGAYGGFRYTSWGQSYGGLPDGETILHLAVREDNSHYPNRFEVGMAISECGADFTVRNSVGKTPRDLNKLLVDALWPMHHWKNKHVLAWMESRGHALRYLPQWKMLFEMRLIQGKDLAVLAVQEEFDRWQYEQLPDLTKLGVASEHLGRESHILCRILREVVADDFKARKFMRKRAKKEREAERVKEEAAAEAARVEAEAKAAEKAALKKEKKKKKKEKKAAEAKAKADAEGTKLPPLTPSKPDS